ncbi:MAG: ribonuclease HI [Candidatus Tokpelaia sp. JSC085]|nr:MAG: ribonuclease HI [Candidatus Tokpelaia sp. JSC085]
MKKISIYTDGSCSGNPGPGGWGGLLIWNGRQREIYGGEIETTNNRMELMAAIHALNILKEPCQVDLYTDSIYVCGGISRWIARWKRNGWRTAAGKTVSNVELWQQLDAACFRHQVKWYWIKGHVGLIENERADALARKGAAGIKGQRVWV